MSKLRTVLQSFWTECGRRKSYWIPLLLLTILSYGYSIAHQTISIDDLRRDYYLGSEATKLSGRWGMILWTRLMGATRYAAFIDKYLAAVFIFSAAIVFAALLYRFLKGHVLCYTVFSSAFVTYPLINEIWEYTGTDFFVCGNMLLCGLSLLWLSVHDGDIVLRPLPLLRRFLLPALALTLVSSSYESGVFFYITAALILLFVRYCLAEEVKSGPLSWVKDGAVLAVPIVSAVILRFVIGFVILRLYRLSYYGGGDAGLRWGETTAFGLFKLVVTNYLVKGLIYFPIGIFACCLGLFFLFAVVGAVRKRRVLPLILSLLVTASLFGLTALQGAIQPYRTGQVFGLFCAFVLFIYVRAASRLPVRFSFVSSIAFVCAMFLCLHMATYLNWILSLNHQRSQNEEAIAFMIGYRLMSEYPDKPVVFTGWGNPGQYVELQVRTDPNSRRGRLYTRLYRALWLTDPVNLRSAETNVNSVITWAKGTDDMLYQFFSYHGFHALNLVPWSEQGIYQEATQIAKDAGLGPYDILECDSYIIVCLGWLDW